MMQPEGQDDRQSASLQGGKRKPWVPPRLDSARDMLDDVRNLKLGSPETPSPVSQTTSPSS